MGRRRGGSSRREDRRRKPRREGSDDDADPAAADSGDAADPADGGIPNDSADSGTGEAGGAAGERGGGPMSMREAVERLHTRAAGRDPDAGPADTEVQQPALVRRFSVGDEEWLVREAGSARAGTGQQGLARIVALRFYRPSEPDEPRREVLVPAVDLETMYDDELRALFARAQPFDNA